MNFIGVPVILGINKQIKDKEAHLSKLYEIEQGYVDMLNYYNYNREKSLQGAVDSKEMQYPEYVTVCTEIDLHYTDKKRVKAITKVSVINNGTRAITIYGINSDNSILGGDKNDIKYPVVLYQRKNPSDVSDDISKAKGFFYVVIKGKMDVPVSNYTDEKCVIPPGGVAVFKRNDDYYCYIFDESGNNVNDSYIKYLKQNGGVVRGGVSTEVMLFWRYGKSEKSNEGGRCIYSNVIGDVKEY